MITEEAGRPGSRAAAPYRRGLDVFDDYDADRVLSEELADDLVNELAGLGPLGPNQAHTHRRRAVRARVVGERAQPVRTVHPTPACVTTRAATRPRLTLVRGGGSAVPS